MLSLPHSRPMPDIGSGCHELRIPDEKHNWRIVSRLDSDAILILEVFPKTTPKTPKQVINVCKKRLSDYDLARKAMRKKRGG
jgi:phage-related protein